MNEVDRILALPKRSYTKEESNAIAAEVTKQLKTKDGTQTLRPAQAIALAELTALGGLLGALRVGGGKTLISLLAPQCFDSRRAILLLPAALIAKTERDRNEYAKHWQVSKSLRLVSYEMLGRTQAAKWLEETFRPDLIIADECHKLKNPRAAVTRRVSRYMEAHPQTRFVALSGTIVRKSLRDYAHLAGWALKDGSPLPLKKDAVYLWADIIDEDANFLSRKDITPLTKFGTSIPEIRTSFRDRLINTPGIVISDGGRGCESSLLVRAASYDLDPQTIQHFKKLREEWITPDGWPLADPVSVWRHARELALGLHYVWDPRPPEEWLEARRAWAAFVRNLIIRSRKYDSEKQVADACESNQIASVEYKIWRSIRGSYKPNVRPIWHSDFGLQACKNWVQATGGGIVWTLHSFFGRALAQHGGYGYFGRGGVSDDGRPIEDTSPEKDGTIVASLLANGTGRNLQKWSRALVTTAPSGGDTWEQLLGRLHREGQLSDEIVFDVLCGCHEHIKAISDARRDASMIYSTTNQEQKLLYCDLDYPEIAPEPGPQWGVT